MSWNVLSVELAIFLAILMVYMFFRRSKLLSLRFVKGLKTYLPPQDQDYDTLEKSNQQARENSKGEKNKYDKKRSLQRQNSLSEK